MESERRTMQGSAYRGFDWASIRCTGLSGTAGGSRSIVRPINKTPATMPRAVQMISRSVIGTSAGNSQTQSQ